MPPKANPNIGAISRSFIVKTKAGPTRRANTSIKTFEWGHRPLNLTLTARELATLKKKVLQDIVDGNVLINGNRENVNGEYEIRGSIHFRSRRITYNSVDDHNILMLAYLIHEGGRDYFIASPPISSQPHSRVHLVIGKHDRRVYVRKLVRSNTMPTEASLWPQSMTQSLHPMHNTMFPPPGAARLVSRENIGPEPNAFNPTHYWSIISEWQEGVTMNMLRSYCGTVLQQTHDLAVIYQLTADLLRAVDQLQTAGKVHQNLAPTNVLISQNNDEMPAATLIDFGRMRRLHAAPFSTIPNYPMIPRGPDAHGVLYCLINLLTTGLGLQTGVTILQGPWNPLLMRFQADVQNSNDHTDWTQWISRFQRHADRHGAANHRPGRLIPPVRHRFGQGPKPKAPLPFAMRDMNTAQDMDLPLMQPINPIGPHQKVWIGLRRPWNTVRPDTDREW